MSMIQASQLIKELEVWAPKSLAYDWDNVGLQVGSLNRPVNKVMVTLDVIEAVVDEAIEKQVDLIIAHHPILFSPPKQINLEEPEGRTIEKLIKNNITVYAAHTNLDVTEGGVSDILLKKLGIIPSEILIKSGNEKLYKLIVYVPETHAELLVESLGNHGAGHIGNYSHCSYQSKGIGSFKPLKGTNPYLGKTDYVERVSEVKVETIIKENQLSKLLSIVNKVHPYEEAAYDVIPLKNNGKEYGAGRIGYLENELTLGELCELIKERLEVPALRVVGELDSEVRKVALLGGSGEDFIEEALKHDVDVYITGDLTFHDAQDGWQMGLNMIDPGHYVEKHMKEAVKSFLDEKMKELGEKVEIIVSEKNTEPFKFL